MLTQIPLPDAIAAKLKPELAKGEEVRFKVASDLTEELKFGERWLVVTNRRILIFGTHGHNGSSRPAITPLKGIVTALIYPVVGGGVLVVRTREGSIPLIHFTNSLSAHFAEAAKGIQQLAKRKELELATDLRPIRCPKCGRLLPDPNERCPFCIKYLQAIGRIVKYLKPYALYTLFTILMTASVTLVQMIPPRITQAIVDRVIPNKDYALLGYLVLGLLAIHVITMLVSMYNGRQLSWLGGKVGTDIRANVFQAVERLSMKYFDRRHVGAIMHRVMNDSGQLQNFLIDGFPYVAQNSILLIFILVILLQYSPLLTLLIMIPVPFMILGEYLFWKFVRTMQHKAWNQYSLLYNRLSESISGVRVVKAFSQEEQEITRFNRQNTKLFQSQYTVDKFWSVFSPSMAFFVTSGSLIVWYMGGYKVLNEEMTLGKLLAFNQYLWMFYGPLQWFNQVNNWMTRAFAGAERIFETIDTSPEVYDPADSVPLKDFKGAVEFKHVTFSYEKGKPALDDVSFKINPGEMIGLVGKSGSGKSTLLSLLCKFYEADEGEILIDGIPIQKVRLEDLRQNIGLVLQDPFLFGSSIYDNISYSRPDATAAEVINAARSSNAHEFIMNKADSYDTRVGERGNRLSGGEKQRISIARAILHNPRILILDEATSSVDSETESKIQQALDRLVMARTTLVAAHRLSTLRNADRIFVMEEGKLAEVGTHEQLLAKKGMYTRLVRAQEKAWRKSKKHLSIAQ